MSVGDSGCDELLSLVRTIRLGIEARLEATRRQQEQVGDPAYHLTRLANMNAEEIRRGLYVLTGQIVVLGDILADIGQVRDAAGLKFRPDQLS